MNRVRTLALTIIMLTAALPLTAAPASSVGEDAGFKNSKVVEHVGDTAYIQLQTGANQIKDARIKVGEAGEDGYTLEATFNRELPSYATITLAFDTSKAGHPNQKTLRVVGTEYSYDTELKVNVQRETKIANPPIDPAVYSMWVYDSRGTLDIGQLTLKAPESPSGEGVGRAKQSEAVSEIIKSRPAFNSVARGDKAVFIFDAPGTESYIKNNTEASQLRRGGPIDSNHGVYLRFTPAKKPQNDVVEPYSLERATVYRGTGDNIYVTVDMSEYRRIDPGTKVEMSLHVRGSNKYVPQGKATIESTLVNRKGSFTTNSNGVVEVYAKDYQKITGSTTVAPGTQIMVVAKSEENPPFFQRAKTTVNANGNFKVRMDYSSLSVGQSVQIGFSDIAGGTQVSVVSPNSKTTPTKTPDDQTTTTPEGETRTQPENTTKTPTSTDNNTTDKNQNTTTPTDSKSSKNKTTDDEVGLPEPQPGFGPVVAILALLGAGLIAVRRQE